MRARAAANRASMRLSGSSSDHPSALALSSPGIASESLREDASPRWGKRTTVDTLKTTTPPDSDGVVANQMARYLPANCSG